LPGPVQRLDAEPVAREMQRAGATVERREGEQAAGARKRAVDAERRDRLDQHLGVRRAAPWPVEFGRHLGAVVELAIVGDDDAAIVALHRLQATRREIDDREPAMAERDAD